MQPDTLVARNSDFYNALWSKTYLTRPERFNTWPLVTSLLTTASHRLEIGPGLRPRLPISGTHFVDISPPALAGLKARGGLVQNGTINALPFADASLELVAAFDVIEHVSDDQGAFREVTRVLTPGGRLIFSVPLHPARWTTFDDYVGHARRYEAAALSDLLTRHGLHAEKSCVFGMQSNNPRVLDYAVRGMQRYHAIAMRCYNGLFFPLGLLFQKRLKFTDGLMDLGEIDEVLVVCRRV